MQQNLNRQWDAVMNLVWVAATTVVMEHVGEAVLAAIMVALAVVKTFAQVAITVALVVAKALVDTN